MDSRMQLEVVEQATAEDGTVIEIVQYPPLSGSSDIRSASELYYAAQAGMRLKMVRIRLSKGRVRAEPGAIYYMKGNLETKASTGGGLVRGLARKMVSGESFFVNEIAGSGEICLEPTFGHFFLHRLQGGEGGVIVDKGLFYAGTSGLNITAAAQRTVSASLFGGEGMFQTLIKGAGVAVLYSPVPNSEIVQYSLSKEKLYVDGNFALMRSEGVTFRTEKSSKSWLSTAVSGEGLLQTFEGPGNVWIAPTQGIYQKLAHPDGLRMLAMPPGSLGTMTDSHK